jgi:NADH:ubiquinone oxidoreductase subunit 4 (subunit M)
MLIAGLLSWITSRWSSHAGKWISLVAVVIDFIIVANLWVRNRGSLSGNADWLINYKVAWIPEFWDQFSCCTRRIKFPDAGVNVLPWYPCSIMFME